MHDKTTIVLGWGGLIGGITLTQFNEIASSCAFVMTLIVTTPKAYAVCVKYGHKLKHYLKKGAVK